MITVITANVNLVSTVGECKQQRLAVENNNQPKLIRKTKFRFSTQAIVSPKLKLETKYRLIFEVCSCPQRNCLIVGTLQAIANPGGSECIHKARQSNKCLGPGESLF